MTARIIGACVEVQKVFGPGLLESAYARALAHEREVPVPAVHKGTQVGQGFRADFVVDHRLILELKTVDAVHPVHRAQLLSYLRLSGLRLGLLINFNQFPVTQGIHRVINSGSSP